VVHNRLNYPLETKKRRYKDLSVVLKGFMYTAIKVYNYKKKHFYYIDLFLFVLQ
jgi:hypothetical protein